MEENRTENYEVNQIDIFKIAAGCSFVHSIFFNSAAGMSMNFATVSASQTGLLSQSTMAGLMTPVLAR